MTWASILDLQKRVDQNEAVLRTLIVWIAQSANTPLSHDDVTHLIAMLDTKP